MDERVATRLLDLGEFRVGKNCGSVLIFCNGGIWNLDENVISNFRVGISSYKDIYISRILVKNSVVES